MILIEIVAAIDAAGTEETFYVSEDRFVTSPTDTPPNIAFLPALLDPGYLGVQCFSGGRTSGGSKLETGEVVIVNTGGELDPWVNYSFDGRPIVIRGSAMEGSAGVYPGDFPILFSGTVSAVQCNLDSIIIQLKDKGFILQTAALTQTYAGTNSLPNGLEGTPTDLQGKLKPKIYGKVFNVSPPQVNTSKLTFQVNNGTVNSIDAVYDRGLALTPGANFANSTLLQAASPSAGTFITCLAEGYFRLGSSPAGLITADVTQGASSAVRTTAQILYSLAIAANVPSGEISSTDVALLDIANSSVVGVWLDGDTTTESAMDQIAASIGAWFGFDPTGILRMGQLKAPTGTPVCTLYQYDIIGDVSRIIGEDNGIPTYRLEIKHTKLWTVQPTDLAGAVTTATRAYLSQEYRSSISEDSSILNQWMLSQPSISETLLTNATDAANEATRRLGIYKVRRDLFEISISADLLQQNSFKLLDEIGINYNRFGLDTTRTFLILGRRLELSRNCIVLTLWGSKALNLFLLNEDRSFLLNEDGSKIILEVV